MLVVMPTGSGKSLCYQLPALLRDDLTVVVSPLVALMQDQVEALRARGLGDRVGVVNAQRDASDNAATVAAAVEGSIRLLYVAPERFSSPGFVDKLRQARLGLFVVDEAHCVSQWGHDFRPDYFRLADAARALDAKAIVASTATATPRVAADVVRRLRLDDPLRVATGFDRPNVSFAVARPGAAREARRCSSRRSAPTTPCRPSSTPGTRAGAEETADRLTQDLGEQALAYHAGLERAHRADVQRRFLADEVRVVVATNAFGMGVDKPNVRTVVHASVPSSLEAYYQEAGRGGRDGARARCSWPRTATRPCTSTSSAATSWISASPPSSPPGLSPRPTTAACPACRSRATTSRPASWPAVGCGFDQLRALIGHLSRAGVIRPSPASADRVAGVLTGAFEGRGEALCRSSIAEAARVRWRQYREIWAYVEGSAAAAPPSCATSATTRRRSPAGRAATSAPAGSCRSCPRPTPGRWPRSTRPSSPLRGLRARRSAAPPAPRSCTARARRRSSATPTTACRPTAPRPTCAARTSSQRIDQLIEERRLSTSGGPYPVLLAPAAPVAA